MNRSDTCLIDAELIIAKLAMQPHPEGGHYVEMYKDPKEHSGRSVGTAIYYLLQNGERSHWHKVDAAEIWHFYAGDPLELAIAENENTIPVSKLLGPDVLADQTPQIVVPAHQWQSANCVGNWTLVGCTVSPGFEFSGFEMAPPNWEPGLSQ